MCRLFSWGSHLICVIFTNYTPGVFQIVVPAVYPLYNYFLDKTVTYSEIIVDCYKENEMFNRELDESRVKIY